MILTVADARRILKASDYGKGHKKQKVRKQAKTENLELADPHDIETLGDIVAAVSKDSKIGKGKMSRGLKVAKDMVHAYSVILSHSALWRDAVECLRANWIYIHDLAKRIENAEVREQREICHIISRLVSDSWLLKDSDERNGKPYKLFGEPLTVAYGRFACQLYRSAGIKRKFWLAYLKETHSDPEGIDKHLRRCFRDRRCAR